MEDRLHDAKVAQLEKLLADHQNTTEFSIKITNKETADLNIDGDMVSIISAIFTGLDLLRTRVKIEKGHRAVATFDEVVDAAYDAYDNMKDER